MILGSGCARPNTGRALVALVLLAAASPAAGQAPARGLVWRRAADLAHASELLALTAAGEQVAAGDATGLWWWRPGEPAHRSLRRGPVRDLVFEPDGALLAATARGLFRLHPVPDGGSSAARVDDISPGPGGARDATRVVHVGAMLICGTVSGAFVQQPAGRWQRVTGLPAREVRALVWDARHARLLFVVDRSLYAAPLAPAPNERVDSAKLVIVAPATRVVLAAADREIVDLAVAPDGRVIALSQRSLLLLAGDRVEARPLSLPPGALALRVGFTPTTLASIAPTLWVATDRGLLLEHAGRLERAAAPAGASAVYALVAQPTRLLAASSSGLLEAPRSVREDPTGAPETPRDPGEPAGAPSRSPGDRAEPTVQAVHRAALRYLALAPERVARLARGARLRGLLPTLELRGGYGNARARRYDRDETFSYGESRVYNDRQVDLSRDLDLVAVLRWDLGDAVYQPESVDVSREARELIELRDDVLDEITQLYYDRRRTLLDLRAAAPADTARLRLRAEELAAGLDAWTGGWWSRALASPSPPGP